MNLKSVGQHLISIGLPVLGAAIAGPAGGLAAKMLAEHLTGGGQTAIVEGVPGDTPNAENLMNLLLHKSESVQKAREFEMTHYATLRKMHLEALEKSDAGQVEVNKIEASSGSLYKGGWRPGAGWVCVAALGYSFLLRPLLDGILQNLVDGWQALPALDMGDLLTLLFGMLGLGAYRTVERVKGKIK